MIDRAALTEACFRRGAAIHIRPAGGICAFGKYPMAVEIEAYGRSTGILDVSIDWSSRAARDFPIGGSRIEAALDMLKAGR